MTEWIISSSVLIAIIIAMRTVLKGRISLRLQYALWGLVLIRLLVPVSFFSSPVSVMNVVPAPVKTVQINPSFSAEKMPTDELPNFDMNDAVWIPAEPGTHGNVSPNYNGIIDNGKSEVITPWNENDGARVKDVLIAVWIAGAAVVGICLIVSNCVFAARLKRSRTETVRKDGMIIYVTSAVATPCIFGLFRPAIYVTPEVVKKDAILRHVLEHELSHKRRGDHIWSALRGICLAIHWFNPLVWVAAELSRRDGELACDEATIKRIGESERMEYGRTLIGLTCAKRTAGTYLVAATTMTGSKKSIKERVKLIAKKPHTAVITLIIVISALLITVGCTFSGAEDAEDADTPWNWAQTLTKDNIASAEIWWEYGEYRAELTDDAKAEFVEILNGLEKNEFTENKHAAGGTPTYGLHIKTADGEYKINEAFTEGGLEMWGHGETSWWIDNGALSEYILRLKTEAAADVEVDVLSFIPEEYRDDVIVYSGEELGDGKVIISVYGKAVTEAFAAADLGEDDGMGWIFSIVRYDQTEYEEYLLYDHSGRLVFAKDDEWYYCRCIPTDVRYYPTGNKADEDRWLEMNEEMVPQAVENFIARYGLNTAVNNGYAKGLMPEDAHDIVSAQLVTRMGTYTFTSENDPNGKKLDLIVRAVSGAKELYPTKCSFGAKLYLVRYDGEMFVTRVAEDGCPMIMSDDTYFEYDRELGNILEIFGVKTHYEEKEYNENGQPVRINHVSWGQIYGTREYVYDSNGRCLEEWYTDGNGEVTERIEYIYDSKGRLIERRLNDNLGTNRTVKYTYDDAGNLMEQMSYDENGEKYIRYSYTYEDGRCTEMEFYCYADGGKYTEKYEYGKWSSPVKVATYNEKGKLNYWHEYEYDDKELCTKEVRYTASGKVECSWTYEYDFENNLKTTSQYDGNGNFIEKWRNPFESGYDPTG